MQAADLTFIHTKHLKSVTESLKASVFFIEVTAEICVLQQHWQALFDSFTFK